jgi:gamma-glutamylcyclotransferase (GGCT)/AIG2-like uncharacterized protein YtfP
MSTYLCKHAAYLGNGNIQGTLYLLDGYPGAVIDKSFPNKIIGDIFGFEDSTLWKNMDNFEEVDSSDEYQRIEVEVSLDSSIVKCQIYTYNRPANDLPIIRSVDFMKYPKNPFSQ